MSYCEVFHGKEKKALSKQVVIDTTQITGYYFIYKDSQGNKLARYMSKDKNKAASIIEKFADKYCTKLNNFWWQIDYCHGHDVVGKLQWSDFYCTEKILTISESL